MQTPSRDLLRKYLKDKKLINFLGSMDTSAPTMSFLTLAIMWHIMSVEGICYPGWGIHGISDRLLEVFRAEGGEYYQGLPVQKILVENNQAAGVLTGDGSVISADRMVSNVDYKSTFLELIDESALEPEFLSRIRAIPYTGSELCVYLGLNPAQCDFSRMKATHLFYCHEPSKKTRRSDDLLDLAGKEIEICRWTDNEPRQVPDGRAGLVLRLGFDHDRFAPFRTGDKKRTPEYLAYKTRLAIKLIKTVEQVIPGLSKAIELMEVATPLTYQDWGRRYQGSIAGWSWSAEWTNAFGPKVLVETPINNLYMVGIYAASKLFMGGVPTAMRTGELAAHLICSDIMPS